MILDDDENAENITIHDDGDDDGEKHMMNMIMTTILLLMPLLVANTHTHMTAAMVQGVGHYRRGKGCGIISS